MQRWAIVEIVRSFFKNDAFNVAASIAFYALLAMIPMAMLMVAAAGYALGSFDEVYTRVVTTIVDLVPWSKELIIANLESTMEKSSHLGIVGIGALLFVSTFLVSSIEMALDRIFRIEKSRNFLHSHLLGIGMICLVFVLLFLPTIVSVAAAALERFGIGLPFAGFMTGKVYFTVTFFIGYLIVVVIVPNRKVYMRYAAVGAVIFAAGIAVAKYLFQLYLSFSLTRYNIIYGSLTAVILSVVWIYYMSLVLLFSAEIVSEIQHRRLFHRKPTTKDETPRPLK